MAAIREMPKISSTSLMERLHGYKGMAILVCTASRNGKLVETHGRVLKDVDDYRSIQVAGGDDIQFISRDSAILWIGTLGNWGRLDIIYRNGALMPFETDSLDQAENGHDLNRLEELMKRGAVALRREAFGMDIADRISIEELANIIQLRG